MRRVAVLIVLALFGAFDTARAQDAIDQSISDAVKRGAAARKAGRSDEMRREISSAAAIAGSLVPRLKSFAGALLDSGFPELAEQVCAQALKLAPDDAVLRGFRGIALARTRQPVDGAADLAIATEKAPDVARFWIELGRARLLANQEAAALTAIERAIAIAPDDIAAFELRAECEYRNRRLPECEATCRLLLAKQPHNALAWQLSIRVQRTLGRIEDALRTADRAIEAIGRHQEIILELGIALLSANRTADAVVALREASAALPEDPRPSLHLCKAYSRLGKTDEAAAARKRYLELAPDLPKAQSRRRA